MIKVQQPHEEIGVSLAYSVKRMSTPDIQMLALSNPDLMQEWLDELLEDHQKYQAQADLLMEEINRLRSQQQSSLLKVA